MKIVGIVYIYIKYRGTVVFFSYIQFKTADTQYILILR